MAIEINIPSQIKKYLSVAFFPATGNDFTLYIANDTNRLYQWDGSDYIEVSQQDAVNWGSIGGDIINQTDLQLAFASMIPYTGATSDVNIGNYDMYVNKLWLYDAVNDNYGSTHYTDGNYHIEDADGHKLLVIEDGFVQIHKTDTIQSNLYTSGLTVTRDHYLPDASGTLALTSDFASYVPTSRTLTINGVTQDLAANRTFTISTGITIGTTAITSGTVGRVLFEGTGNVVQESANLFWDNTNGRLGIGTSTPAQSLDVRNGFILNSGGASPNSHNLTMTSSSATESILLFRGVNTNSTLTLSLWNAQIIDNNATKEVRFFIGGGSFFPTFYSNGAEAMRLSTNRNLLIGTTTDAGFKLDVNGTARVQNQLSLGVSGTAGRVNLARQSDGNMIASIYTTGSNVAFDNGAGAIEMRPGALTGRFGFLASGNMVLSTTGALTDTTSALLSMVSTTKGFLPPRMTTAQKNAIASPAAGLMVYDTTLNIISFFNGTIWI